MNSFINSTNKKYIYDYFNRLDAYSGEKLTQANISFDHIVPKSKGGTNDIHNIVCCTRTNNTHKWSKDLEKWYKNQPFFSQTRLNKIIEWKNK